MANDWTCARCGAANPPTVHACQACGFIRGGVVPLPNPTAAPSTPPPPPGAWPPGAQPPSQAPIPGWSAAPAATPSGRGRRLALARVVVIGLLVAGAGAYSWYNDAHRAPTGEIDKTGELDVSDLRVGDCYDLPGDLASLVPWASAAETVEKAIARPCTESHHYEVFYTGVIGGSSYPTTDEFDTWTETYCTPAFETYVGKSFRESVLDVYTFYPLSEGWARGDHAMQCSLADPLMHPLTSTLKGSRR